MSDKNSWTVFKTKWVQVPENGKAKTKQTRKGVSEWANVFVSVCNWCCDCKCSSSYLDKYLQVMLLISVLCLRSSDNAARAMEAGAGELAIQAMKMFPAAQQMQRSCCLMVRNLAVRNAENRQVLKPAFTASHFSRQVIWNECVNWVDRKQTGHLSVIKLHITALFCCTFVSDNLPLLCLKWVSGCTGCFFSASASTSW